jgi:hypothetical protein
MALQKLTKEKQDAARQLQLQAGQQGTPPTVAEQVGGEALSMTKQEIAQQNAGLASLAAPNITPQAFNTGGVVGFSGGGYTTPDVTAADVARAPGMTAEERRWNPALTREEESGTAEDRRRNTGPAKGTAQQDTLLILKQEYLAAVQRGDQPTADALLREMRTAASTGRMSGTTAADPAVRGEPPYSEPSQVRTARRAPSVAASDSYPEPLAAREQRQVQSNDSLADQHLREQLTVNPQAARSSAQSQFDTEYGTAASEMQKQRMAQHSQGLERLKSAQQKRLTATDGIDTRPEWLQKVSAMAAAPYDPKSAPAGLAGLAMVNRGASAYLEGKKKSAQDRADMELEFTNEVQKYVRAGWPVEDAQLKVAEDRYGVGETAEKTAAAGKDVGVQRVFEARKAREYNAAIAGRSVTAPGKLELQALKDRVPVIKAQLAAMEKQGQQFSNPDEYARLQNELNLIDQQLAAKSGAPAASTATADPVPAGKVLGRTPKAP